MVAPAQSLDFEGGLIKSSSEPLVDADRLNGRCCSCNGEGGRQASTDTSGTVTDDVNVVPRSGICGRPSVVPELFGSLSSGSAAGGTAAISSAIHIRDRRVSSGLSRPRRAPEVARNFGPPPPPLPTTLSWPPRCDVISVASGRRSLQRFLVARLFLCRLSMGASRRCEVVICWRRRGTSPLLSSAPAATPLGVSELTTVAREWLSTPRVEDVAILQYFSSTLPKDILSLYDLKVKNSLKALN